MLNLQWINLALRAFMELGIVLALGYWGSQSGDSSEMKIILGTGAPLIGFGFWGLVDFRKEGTFAEPLRLIQEIFVSGLAALALYVVEAKGFALILASVTLLHHILVYVSGKTLLKKSVSTKGV